MIHDLFPQKVRLFEDEHKYFHDNGDEYMSFSRLFGFLSDKFDAESVSKYVAKNSGVTKSDVLADWQSRTEEGTRVDNALTLYAQTGQILDSDKDLTNIVKHVLEKYKDYHRCYEQVVVYSEKYRCAGSLDKLSITSNRKNGSFVISDFKRFQDGMSYKAKGQRWLNYPLDYLTNSKYVKISIQCSYYALLFSELTGRPCERLFCDMIIPVFKDSKIVGYKNQEIPLMYMKPEVELILETFSKQINSSLTPLLEDESF